MKKTNDRKLSRKDIKDSITYVHQQMVHSQSCQDAFDNFADANFLWGAARGAGDSKLTSKAFGLVRALKSDMKKCCNMPKPLRGTCRGKKCR